MSTGRRPSPAKDMRYGHKVSVLEPEGRVNRRGRRNIPRACILLRRRRGQNGAKAGSMSQILGKYAA